MTDEASAEDGDAPRTAGGEGEIGAGGGIDDTGTRGGGTTVAPSAGELRKDREKEGQQP